MKAVPQPALTPALVLNNERVEDVGGSSEDDEGEEPWSPTAEGPMRSLTAQLNMAFTKADQSQDAGYELLDSPIDSQFRALPCGGFSSSSKPGIGIFYINQYAQVSYVDQNMRGDSDANHH